ncbi:MAG: hypothetical protein KI785_08150 [Devosiaceae bacterium]|nr:hypothetical protein [Devosiaceae bacterium MH13]
MFINAIPLKACLIGAALALGVVAPAQAGGGMLASGAGASQAAFQAAIGELREMHASCESMGGSMVYDDGHLVETVFSDDGQPDFVVLAERAYCDGAASLFCGSRGCAVSVFATIKGDVVSGGFSLFGPEVSADRVTYGCPNGGRGDVLFTGGGFDVSGC